jgi:hypothetical protein
VTLKHTRWVLLKRKENLSSQYFRRLKEQFQDFWGCESGLGLPKYVEKEFRNYLR